MKGFTLIELVITMTISAILSVVVAVFIARPIVAYGNMQRRAELVDAADITLRRMSRDIQRAVPNSLRVKVDPGNSNRVAVEFVNIVEGMRYRGAGTGPFLDFTTNTSLFNVIGQFQFALSNPTCLANACRLVIYNTGASSGGAIPSDNPAPGANVYSTLPAPNCSNCLPPPGSVTITPTTTTVTLSNPSSEGQVSLSTGALFALPSYRQRVDIVDTPITYICDSSAGVQSITRYWNYSITPVQPTNPSAAPLNTAQSAQLTQNIGSCSFNYSAGTAQRNGIITLNIVLTKGGESITLLRQIGVDNSP